jgi:hypothetical protein
VLAAIGAWTIGHKIFEDQLSATANPNRMRFYAVPFSMNGSCSFW